MMMKQFSFLFLFINALFFGQANVSYDSSFGNNGRLLTNNSAQFIYPPIGGTQYRTIQNTDNKLISVSGAASISRYNLDGTLDNSFGVSGTRVVTTTSGYYIKDIANLSDGSILVLLNGFPRSYILKYSSNGTLDTTFGTAGSLELVIATYLNSFDQLKILTDDSILIGGLAATSSTSTRTIGVIKLDKNGSYDTSFSLDGKVTLSSTLYSYNGCIGIDTDSANNIYVGFQSTMNNTSNHYGNVQKLSPNGNIISNFGTSGIASQFVNGDCKNMKVFPNGKILIAAESITNGTNDIYLMVFNQSGILDTSIGNGTFRFDIDNGSNDYIEKITIVDNNTFYLTGYIITGGITYGLILKLNSNFALDSNFNYSGIFATSYFLNKNSTNYDLIIQKDRKLLLSGAGEGTQNNINSYIGFIRLIDSKLLATNESIKVNSISIYPNPASDFINLQFNKSLTDQAYEIVDMTGKTVLRSKVSGKTINISSLIAGNYILKIDNESYKFIKK